MDIIRFTDETKVKCTALKNTGINVKLHQIGNRTVYEISLDDNPNADKFFDTRFYNINDILIAFRDRLYNNRFVVVAA